MILSGDVKSSSTLRRGISKFKRIKCFRPVYAGDIWKSPQLPVILNLYFSNTRAGEYHVYRDSTFEKLRFQNDFFPHKAKVSKFIRFEERRQTSVTDKEVHKRTCESSYLSCGEWHESTIDHRSYAYDLCDNGAVLAWSLCEFVKYPWKNTREWIQLFRERLSYKQGEKLAQQCRNILWLMVLLRLLDWASRCFGVVGERNSTNKRWSRVFSLLLLKHREPQSRIAKLFLPIMPIGIVAYSFILCGTTFVETAVYEVSYIWTAEMIWKYDWSTQLVDQVVWAGGLTGEISFLPRRSVELLLSLCYYSTQVRKLVHLGQITSSLRSILS